MMNKKRLHQVEMNLICLFENEELTKETIITEFTNLIDEVKE